MGIGQCGILAVGFQRGEKLWAVFQVAIFCLSEILAVIKWGRLSGHWL